VKRRMENVIVKGGNKDIASRIDERIVPGNDLLGVQESHRLTTYRIELGSFNT